MVVGIFRLISLLIVIELTAPFSPDESVFRPVLVFVVVHQMPSNLDSRQISLELDLPGFIYSR